MAIQLKRKKMKIVDGKVELDDANKDRATVIRASLTIDKAIGKLQEAKTAVEIAGQMINNKRTTAPLSNNIKLDINEAKKLGELIFSMKE